MKADLKNAMRKLLDDVESDHGILDAYKAAQGLQRAYPGETVTLEEIIAAAMAGTVRIRAIEFDPQPS